MINKAFVQRVSAEFIGTLYFLTAIGNILESTSLIHPLAVGLSLFTAIHLTGFISGSMYNPAVTIGAMLKTWFI